MLRPRIEPYDPNARDGDGDGIVQEGTPWERPVGTRLLNNGKAELARWNKKNPDNPYPASLAETTRSVKKRDRIGSERRIRDISKNSENPTLRAFREKYEVVDDRILPVTQGGDTPKAVFKDGIPQVGPEHLQKVVDAYWKQKAAVEEKYGPITTVKEAKAALRKAFPNIPTEPIVGDKKAGLTLSSGNGKATTLSPATRGLVISLLAQAEEHPEAALSIRGISNAPKNNNNVGTGMANLTTRPNGEGSYLFGAHLTFHNKPHDQRWYREWVANQEVIVAPNTNPADTQVLVELELDGTLTLDDLQELGRAYVTAHEIGHVLHYNAILRDMGIDMSKPWDETHTEGLWKLVSGAQRKPFYGPTFKDALAKAKEMDGDPDLTDAEVVELLTGQLWYSALREPRFGPYFKSEVERLVWDNLTTEQRVVARRATGLVSGYAATDDYERIAETHATRSLNFPTAPATTDLAGIPSWMKTKAAQVGDDQIDPFDIEMCHGPSGRPGLIYGDRPSRRRKMASKTEIALNTKALNGHVEPYDPDAIDADGDGIVQEGTPWERPVGTRAFHQLLRGSADVEREIRRGETANLTGVRIGVGEVGPKYGETIPYVRKADIGTLTKAPAHDSKKFVADAKARMESEIPKGATRSEALEEIDTDIQHLGEEIKAGHHVPEHTELLKWLEEQRKVQAARKMSDDLVLPDKNDLAAGETAWSEGWPDNLRNLFSDVLNGPETADAAWDGINKATREYYARKDDATEAEILEAIDESWQEYLLERRKTAALLNEVSDATTTDEDLYRGELRFFRTSSELEDFTPGTVFDMDVRGFSRSDEAAAYFYTPDPLKEQEINRTPVLFVIKAGDTKAHPLDYGYEAQFANELETLVAGKFEVSSVTEKKVRNLDYPLTVITIVQTATMPMQPKSADGQWGWR